MGFLNRLSKTVQTVFLKSERLDTPPHSCKHTHTQRGFLRVKMRDYKMELLHDYFFVGEDMEGAAVLEIGHHKFSLEWRSRQVDGVCLQGPWSHDAPCVQLT